MTFNTFVAVLVSVCVAACNPRVDDLDITGTDPMGPPSVTPSGDAGPDSLPNTGIEAGTVDSPPTLDAADAQVANDAATQDAGRSDARADSVSSVDAASDKDAGPDVIATNDADSATQDAASDTTNHQCESDVDCAKFNTSCMTFTCLSFQCFETHDTCGLDAGTDVQTDGVATCEPALVIEWVDRPDMEVCPGEIGVKMLTVRVTAQCQDMMVWRSAFQMMTLDFNQSDSTPFCTDCSAPGAWNFLNTRLVNESGQVVAGPTPLRREAVNAPAYSLLTDQFSLKQDKPVELTFLVDIASTFSSPLEVTKYQTILEDISADGNIPLVVNVANSGGTNPSRAVKVKSKC